MSEGKKIILGTRGSKLALWQANRAKDLISSEYQDLNIVFEIVKTKGDIIADTALSKIGDEGLFTKAIEDALLAGTIDIGVHSSKDMPTVLSKGLHVAAYPEREDLRDALISKDGKILKDLEKNPVIGTSSLRRRAFLKRARPDSKFIDLRGNVDTRLKKLDGGDMDAIIMAYAAVKRMGLNERVSELFDPQKFLPAVGQGSLALEMRKGDPKEKYVKHLDDKNLRMRLEAERSFLETLQGGCQVPVGCLTKLEGERMEIKGSIANLEGDKYYEDSLTGDPLEARKLGIELAQRILADVGQEILDEIRGTNG